MWNVWLREGRGSDARRTEEKKGRGRQRDELARMMTAERSEIQNV